MQNNLVNLLIWFASLLKTWANSAIATAKGEAIDAAAADATTKANTAKSEAVSEAASDATTKANTAKSEAIAAAALDATSKADTAKSEAIAAAALDATSKADTAKSEAISAAALDATSKADTAKSEAITAAAADATSKADTAEQNAINAGQTAATGAYNDAKAYTDEQLASLSLNDKDSTYTVYVLSADADFEDIVNGLSEQIQEGKNVITFKVADDTEYIITNIEGSDGVKVGHLDKVVFTYGTEGVVSAVLLDDRTTAQIAAHTFDLNAVKTALNTYDPNFFTL